MTASINGAQDHSDEEIVAVLENGQRYKVLTCASIDYENGGEAGEIGGNQAGPVALTRGKRSPKWSMEIAKFEFQRLVVAMGHGYPSQNIQWLISYRPVGGLPRMEDVIQNARMTQDGHKSATGDPNMVSVGGKCVKVLYNGIDPDPVQA